MSVCAGSVSTEPGERTVPLVAVTYRSQVLGDRPLVRLVEANLREAEDLTLRAVGLTADEGGDAPVVGHGPQRALGFPEWLLITDPANVRLALKTAEQLGRAMKRASSSPKAALKSVEAIAADLGRTAPHFLPTFHEEVARGMIAADQASFAGRLFARARDAERAHALPIDEERHAAAFLEFTLAGAINAQDLRAESTALLERREAAEALERFTTLVRERALAGSPPYPSIGADVRRLATAAEDEGAEVEVLRDLLLAPSIARAPKGFWSSSGAAVVRLAHSDERVQRRLLEVVPNWDDGAGIQRDEWIDLLEEAGALELLTSGAVDPVEWVQSVIGHAGYSRRLIEVILSLGDRLCGVHITLGWKAHTWGDPEMLDVLLGVGATLDPEAIQHIPLRAWVGRRDRRDLPHLAEHADLATKVDVGAHVDGDLSTLLGHPGARALLRRYVTPDLPEHLSLPGFEQLMAKYTPLVTVEALPVVRDEVEPVFRAMHPPKLIADVLRLGLPAEMTWPALEDAVQRARAASPDVDVDLTLSWPAVGVVAGDSVTFVDGDRVVAEHAVGQGHHHSFVLVHGDVLAFFLVSGSRSSQGVSRHVQWSSSPGTLLVHETGLPSGHLTLEVPGGRLTHMGLLRPGEAMPTQLHPRCDVLGDGHRFWINGSILDPATGRRDAERVVPPALADLARAHEGDGLRLHLHESLLMPVAPTTADSRMSTVDGLHAVAALGDGRHLLAVVTADGTRVDLPHTLAARRHYDTSSAPWVTERPGGGRWLVRGGALHDLGTGQELGQPKDEAGKVHPIGLLPAAAWHQLRVRDESASARLRVVSQEQAAHLWEQVRVVSGRHRGVDVWGILRELVRPGSPAMAAAGEILGTTDETLCGEVVRAAAWAGWNVVWSLDDMEPVREAVRTGAAGGPGGTSTRTLPWPVTDLEGLSAIHARLPLGMDRRLVPAVAGRLGLRPVVDESSDHWWWLEFPWRVVGHERAVLALAASPFRTREELESIAGIVGDLCDAGLLDGSIRPGWVPTAATEVPGKGSYRVGAVLGPGADDPATGTDRALLLESGGATTEWLRVLVRGRTSTVRGLPITWPRTPAAIESAQLVAVLERLLEHGAPTWDPALTDVLAEATGWSRGAAALLLAGVSTLWDPRANFLAKEVRTSLRITVAEARAGQVELRRIDREVVPLAVLLGAAVPVDDPARIVTEGPDVAAIVRVWHEHAPDDDGRPSLPAEILLEATRATGDHNATGRVERLLAGGDPTPADLDLLLWFAHRLPGDSSMRDWVGARLDHLRQSTRASADALLVAQAHEGAPGTDRAAVRRRLGMPQPERPDRPGAGREFELGQLELVERAYTDRIVVPAGVADWGPVIEQIRGLRALPLDTRPGWRLELLVGDGLDSLIADLLTDGGGEPRDPRVSAPEVVSEVSADLGLSEDASAYWLQLLALADPTDRMVQARNGWTPARRKKAGAELVERGLVVQGKRARSGRSLFLPGGWLEASAPHPPLEEWKATPFALLDRPRVTPALDVVVPLTSSGDLFRGAWARWTDGDRPGATLISTEDA